jgi:hypothetical protein
MRFQGIIFPFLEISGVFMNSFIGGLSDKLKNRSKPKYSERSLFPILSAEQLIIPSERIKFEKKISDYVRVPSDNFKTLYASLINNFIEYAQVLPMRYGDPLGGILQEGLRHGYFAVQLLRETTEGEPDPLFTYAVFSMALLSDVMRVMHTQKDWCPFNGNLIEAGAEFYKLREYASRGEVVVRAANPMLAQTLMPELGMAWIASDATILDMWLACLSGYPDWAGKMGHLKKLLKKIIDENKASEERVGMIPTDFIDEPSKEDPGEDFLAWLKEQLENEKISVNKADSKVHISDEWMYVDNSLFEDFTKAFSKYTDWRVVQAHFNELGLTKLSGADYKFEQYFSERPEVKASRLGGFLSHAHDKTGDANRLASVVERQNNMALNQKVAAQNSDATPLRNEGALIDNKVVFIQGTPPENSPIFKMAITAAVAQVVMQKMMNQLETKAAHRETKVFREK